MNWKKILKHYNGWIGFAVGSILFFISPPLYHLVDPTAGQFDAGYIHTIIFAMVAVSFASGFSWLMLRLLAPALFKALDQCFDGDSELNIQSAVALTIYLVTMAMLLIVVIALV